MSDPEDLRKLATRAGRVFGDPDGDDPNVVDALYFAAHSAADEIERLQERVLDLEQEVEGTDREVVRLRRELSRQKDYAQRRYSQAMDAFDDLVREAEAARGTHLAALTRTKGNV